MKLLSLLFVFASACAPIVKQSHALQPSQAVDTPAVWVEVITDDPKANGIYRCVDSAQQPVCRRAAMVR